VLSDYLHSAAYQATPFALSPYDEQTSLQSITSKSIEDFVTNNFTSKRIVVVASGGVNEAQVTKLVGQHFSTVPKGADIPKHPPQDFTGSEIKIRDDSFHTLYSIIAYEGVGFNDPDYWTCLVLQEIFGPSWSKHTGSSMFTSYITAESLYQYILEDLAHKYKTLYYPYHSSGLFGFYLECDEGPADDAVYEVLNAVQKIYSYLSPEELQGAKNRVVARILKESTCAMRKNNLLGQFGLHSKRLVTPAEMVARISELSAKDVSNFIAKYMYDVDVAVVCHGPHYEFPEYNITRAWTYWNRW